LNYIINFGWQNILEDEYRRFDLAFNKVPGYFSGLYVEYKEFERKFYDREKPPTSEKITCNGCGLEYLKDYCLNAEVSGGYGSTHLMDLTKYSFSLCESCLEKLFFNFKIPVKVKYIYEVTNVQEKETEKA
jgi:hypothetical protein